MANPHPLQQQRSHKQTVECLIMTQICWIVWFRSRRKLQSCTAGSCWISARLLLHLRDHCTGLGLCQSKTFDLRKEHRRKHMHNMCTYVTKHLHCRSKYLYTHLLLNFLLEVQTVGITRKGFHPWLGDRPFKLKTLHK